MSEISTEDRKLLLQLELAMDRGEQPFIIVEGSLRRWAYPAEVLAAAGIASGAKLSPGAHLALMRFNLAALEERIAFEAGQALAKEVLS